MRAVVKKKKGLSVAFREKRHVGNQGKRKCFLGFFFPGDVAIWRISEGR